MASNHPPPCLQRLRRPPKQFSWVDHRLVREGAIDSLTHQEMALYLFLVTVADAQGISFYGDTTLMKRLRLDPSQLQSARGGLIHNGLIAFKKPTYQVLALDPLPPVPSPAGRGEGEPLSIGQILKRAMEASS